MTDAAAITIRDARPEEVNAIRSLTMAAYREYADVMPPRAWEGLSAAIQRGLSGRSPAERIVAVRDGKLLGSVMLYPAAVDAYAGATRPLNWPEVRLLAVSPDSRGQGIGIALMRECIRRAIAAGATHLGVHTSQSMRPALSMYKEMGFKRLPEYDFHPPGAEIVEAHVLTLER